MLTFTKSERKIYCFEVLGGNLEYAEAVVCSGLLLWVVMFASKMNLQPNKKRKVTKDQDNKKSSNAALECFECALCGKQYKTKRWYENHLKSHSVGVTPGSVQSSQVSDDQVDSQQQVIQEHLPDNYEWGEWSDDEIPSYFELCDEEEERRRNDALHQDQSVQNKASQPKKKKKKALVKCKECNKIFYTLAGYVNHLVGHGMKAACLRIPSLDTIFDVSPRFAVDVLEDIISSKLTYGVASLMKVVCSDLKKEESSDMFLKFVKKVCEGCYSVFVKKSDFLLPSDMVVAYYKHTAAYISDADNRKVLYEILTSDSLQDKKLWNVLITTFFQKFSNKLLAYILRVIRQDSNDRHLSYCERYATTKQSTDSTDFKQVMHFIGGSNVRSVLKTAMNRKHPHEEWDRVAETVRNNFLLSSFSSAPDVELMAWTQSVDRGGLKVISADALDFFVLLGKEVKPLEHLDGSLITNEVFDKISESPDLLIKWDYLKGSLNESESFKLLHALVCHFCVTWRNGVISRRKDELAARKDAQTFGAGGVAFRPMLAGIN